VIRPRPFHFDDALWPLLIVCPRGTPTDAEYRDYLERMTGYLGRGEAFTSLIDLSQAGMTARHRHMAAAWCQENDRLLRERLLGTAFIVASPFQRLCVSVVFHLKPPTQPHVVVARWEPALTWAALRLEAAGQWEAAARVRGAQPTRAWGSEGDSSTAGT
jgi:hypothetical protein